MIRTLMLSAACAALVFPAAAFADIGEVSADPKTTTSTATTTTTIDVEIAAPEAPATPQAPEVPATQGLTEVEGGDEAVRARIIKLRRDHRPSSVSVVVPSPELAPIVVEPIPAKLVNFDGGFELLKTARRMRIWGSHLGYKLTIDESGAPTDCELTEKFRRKIISVRLCELLIEHHEFEPARSSDNTPVEGSYTNRISYMELREAE